MSVSTPPTDHHTIAEPRYSMWGPVQTCQTIAPGIFQVTTASHGGFILSAERIAEMPTALQKPDGNCFEEDCAWCLVVLSFPAYFPHTLFEEAVRTCKNWFPTEWETWTGTTLDPSESREKREAHFYQHHRHHLIVTTAWGDWHPQVPAGYVGVCAKLGGRAAQPISPDHYFLVPVNEYRATTPFIVDPTRHPSMQPIR